MNPLLHICDKQNIGNKSTGYFTKPPCTCYMYIFDSVRSKHALATQTFREGRESEIECAKVRYLNSLIY